MEPIFKINGIAEMSPKDLLPRFSRAVAYFKSDTIDKYDKDVLDLKNVSIDKFVSKVEKRLKKYEEDDVHYVYVYKIHIEIKKDDKVYIYEKILEEDNDFDEFEVLMLLGFRIED